MVVCSSARLHQAEVSLSSSPAMVVSLEASTSSLDGAFDPVSAYRRVLADSKEVSMPAAAVAVLADVLARSTASTMTELIQEIEEVSTTLKAAAANPISLSAGTALLLRFVTLQSPASARSFDSHKQDLANRAREFCRFSPKCAELIAQGAFLSLLCCFVPHALTAYA